MEKQRTGSPPTTTEQGKLNSYSKEVFKCTNKTLY